MEVTVLQILLWILVVACFALSFVGLIFPVVPGVPFLWAAALIYHLGIGDGQLGWFFWAVLVVASIFIFVSDIIANKLFLEKADSSEWSGRVGPLAIIVGAFVFPPFGLIFVPFAAVFITEMLHQKTYQEAFRLAGITVVSFLTSTLAKAIVQVGIIILFVISVVFF